MRSFTPLDCCHFNSAFSCRRAICIQPFQRNCPCLPLFICVFHLAVQSTVDKGLCKGCLRTRRSSSSIFFEVFPTVADSFWECCLLISNEFSLKQQRFHLVKATANQEVYYCFALKPNSSVKMCVPKFLKIIQIQFGCF